MSAAIFLAIAGCRKSESASDVSSVVQEGGQRSIQIFTFSPGQICIYLVNGERDTNYFKSNSIKPLWVRAIDTLELAHKLDELTGIANNQPDKEGMRWVYQGAGTTLLITPGYTEHKNTKEFTSEKYINTFIDVAGQVYRSNKTTPSCGPSNAVSGASSDAAPSKNNSTQVRPATASSSSKIPEPELSSNTETSPLALLAKSTAGHKIQVTLKDGTVLVGKSQFNSSLFFIYLDTDESQIGAEFTISVEDVKSIVSKD